MKESLAQTLRGGLYDNPLVLLDRRGSEPIRHFLSDPELDLPLEKKVPCQLCEVGLLWHEKYEISGRYQTICKSCFDKNK